MNEFPETDDTIIPFTYLLYFSMVFLFVFFIIIICIRMYTASIFWNGTFGKHELRCLESAVT